MAVIKRITRLANPARRRKRKAGASLRRAKNGRFLKRSASAGHRRRTKKRNSSAKSRRKVRNPQVTFTLASPKTSHRKRKASAAVKRRRRPVSGMARRRKAQRRKAHRNPAPVLVSLGYLNPSHKGQQKGKQMARRKSRSNSRRRATSRRRHTRRSYRNPSFAGISSNFMTGVGVLLGMTATKMVTGFIPATLQSGPLMRLAASAAATFAVNFAAKRFAPSLAQGMLYGGLAQTGAIALNAFVPSVAGRVVPAGLGDIVPGSFVVPQNPISRPAPLVNAKPGLAGAFRPAF